MAETVEDVLRHMDELSRERSLDGYYGAMVAGWLAVLRPALSVQTLFEPPAPSRPDFENLSLRSNLPQDALRDLHMTATLSVDHEGGGYIQLEYSQVPPEHRLQALLSIMGALGDRIALAMGEEAYRDLLRGVLARRERHG
jgi:hypothetical protein